MNNWKRPLALSLAAVMLIALGSVLWPGGFLGSKQAVVLAAELNMSPTKGDSAGSNLDTQFVISSSSTLDPRFIKEHLSVEPTMDFTVKKNDAGGKEVVVVPQELLEPRKVYKFSLALEGQPPMRWAFQTKGDFKVVSTLPRDKSSGVPVDSGIEINFSHLNFEKFEDYFSIDPKVEGRFEIHKKTAVFVPKHLDPSTVYTVTVKKGLPLAGSDQTLEEDLVFQFETQQTSPPSQKLYFFKDIYEFTTDEKPLFQSSYYGETRDNFPQEGDFTLYRYKGAKNYIDALEQRQRIPYWAYLSRDNYREDVSGLEVVGKFSLPTGKYEGVRFFEFPEALPAGYYVAEAAIGDGRHQFWFQVTDLGLYAAVAENKTLVWVNDLTSGSPVAGADVSIFRDGGASKTDDSGLALLATPREKATGVYAIISKGNREAVAAIQPWNYGDDDWKELVRFRQSYWKYLYVDRSLYKSEDTVHFWGLVKPRNAGESGIGRVKVELASGGWKNEGSIDIKEVVLDDFTFTDSIKLPKLTPGYYYLNLIVDDEVLTSQGFEVQTFQKPLYQLEVAPERKAMFVGDTMNFDIKATFFEGTPAARMSLNYYIDKQGTIATDDLGEAILPYTPAFNVEESRWSPQRSKGLYLSAHLPESGDIHGETWVTVLNNDVDFETKASVVGNTATIDMTVNKLTVDKVNSGQVEPWDRDAYKEGIAPNRPVSVKVYREVWDKVEAGQYYDFINKKVQTRYHYNYRKVLEAEDEFTTDAQGHGSYSFPVEEDASYIAEFTCIDYRGNPAIREVWVSGRNFYREYEYSWYHLEHAKSPGVYSAGEAVTLIMKNNESTLPSRSRGFMFYTARQGILEARVQDSSEFHTVFQQDLIPNFWAKGVYFDGRYYQESYDQMISFDAQEKALKLEITTDKSEYRPQDTVQVKVEVRDKAGKPVEAKVNLNLVDEALYALSDQYVNLLNSLYGDSNISGIDRTLRTHEAPYGMDGGAEHGGEGGSERKDFRDAVFFKTLTTDKSGVAQASFQVPDNLTSWRITGQAVTQDLSAATATSAVVVKQPFFVDMVINDRYLAGDAVEVPLRSFGSKLKSGGTVEYDVALATRGQKVFSKALTGKAFTPTYLSLPPLTAGEYQLTVTGKAAGDLADTLTLGFKVEDTLMTQEQVDFYLLEEGIQLKGSADAMTRLTFSDYQRSQYLEMLWRLRWAHGHRMDQRIAPSVAHRLLGEYFPDIAESLQDEAIDLSEYQTEEGGIALLPYSGVDLELSAKAANLMDNGFDRGALEKYFNTIAEDPRETRERGIIALYGLAALDEPVLQELILLSKEEDLTIKERLYIALALIELGDEPSAAKNLKSVLGGHGEAIGAMLRINAGEDKDDVLEATALAAVAAVSLGFEEQNKLQAYVLENRTKDILLYPEQLMFLEKALPRLPDQPVSFTYSIGGQRQEVKLEPRENLSLLLTPDKLATLKFDNPKGKVGVLVSYRKPFEVPADIGADGVKVYRSYEVSGKTTKSFKSTDLVKINISFEFGPKAMDGAYAVTDFLPAGLKPVTRPYYHGLWDPQLRHPVEVEGQRVVFVITKDTLPFHYYARIISPGEFKAEPAVISHIKSGKVYNITEVDKVTIK